MSERKKDWITALLFFLLTGGVTWAASAVMEHSTRIAVEENNTKNVNLILGELKEGQKMILAEMRR